MSEQAVMEFAAETEAAPQEAAPQEAAPQEAAPQEAAPVVEESSFAQAFEDAMSRLEQPQEPTPTPEPAQEPEQEPAQQEEKKSDAEAPAEEQPKEEPAEKPEVEAEEKDSAEEEKYDPTDELDTEDTTDWTPKAARRFKQLKEERKVLRSEVEDLRQKTQEYESKIQELSGAVDSEDIEGMREQLAEYEQQKMFTDLENTTAYKEAVTEPLLSLLEKAEQVADHYDIDADALVDVISMEEGEAQDEALSDILDGVSDRDKAKVFRIIEDINPILSYRTELINNLEKAYNEAQYLEEQKQKEMAAQKAQERKVITKNVVDRVKEKVPFLAGFENVDFDALTQNASEKDPAVIHPVDAAYNSVAAQLLPTVIKEYSALQAELDNLADRLADYEDAEPGTSGSTPDSAKMAATSGGDISFEDAISRRLSGLV